MRFSKIIIIGAGPAGLSCAIQLKRMGLDPLVIEKDMPGGLLFNANIIENYPGFPGGISGPELAGRIAKQALAFNVNIQQDACHLVQYSDNQFILNCKSGYIWCEILVLATGTNPVIPVNLDSGLVNSGLIHFDISHLRNVTGKKIGIIGAGDAAFDYSLTLSQNGNEVLIFNRSQHINALNDLKKKVFINNQVKYFENHTLNYLEIIDNKILTAIINSASGNKKYSLDYLIFAIGRKPADGFYRESLEGFIPNLLREKRLYLIGDLINGNYRQVSIATGQGIRAAMEIFQNESNQ